ncbi:hypothetical protein ACFL25_01025 [Patescibacteria group bacterium]
MVKREIIYYTDCKLENTRLLKEARKTVVASGLPILTISLDHEVDLGRNVVLKGKRSQNMLFSQLILGLLISDADFVFFCEHDVLYHPSHFEFTPPTDDKYYYNNNVYKYRLSDRKVVGYDCHWLSQLCAGRKLLIDHYIKRLRRIADGNATGGYEPGTGRSRKIESTKYELWESKYPNIDIRHGKNWTGVNRMDPSEFRNKKTCQNFKEINIEDIPEWDPELLLSI